jgi:hypothetical protein
MPLGTAVDGRVPAAGSCDMEDDEFTHPGLRMIRSPRSFMVMLPVKSDRYRRFLHGVWLAVWLAGEAALIAGLQGALPLPALPQPVLLTFLAAFTAAGFFVLYRLLWYMAGREVYTVTGDKLSVRSEIWGIGYTREYERRSIRRIQGRRLNYEVVYPSWGRMFIGHGNGEILIEQDGEVHAYGKGLKENEARLLASLLHQELQVRSGYRRPTEVRAG